MRKDKQTFRAAALASMLAMAAPVVADAPIENYWKSAPTTTAWVTPYGECWQGFFGEQLDPCGAAPKPMAPLVLNLLFELDRYRLENIRNPQELRKIDELIQRYQATPETEQVSIVGHTDRLGSLPHNLTLSKNRADTVKNYMISRGYPASAIVSVTGVAWEGQDEVGEDGQVVNLGPLDNNPARRRVVVNTLR